MQLNVPREAIDRIDLAFVMAHEMAHIKGRRHKDMRGAARWDDRVPGCRQFYRWAEDFPLDKKTEPKRKPKFAGDKLQHCRQLLRQWESKKKRAETYIRKYRARVRYYERRAAATTIREYLDTLDSGRFNYRPGFGCSMCDYRAQCQQWSGRS